MQAEASTTPGQPDQSVQACSTHCTALNDLNFELNFFDCGKLNLYIIDSESETDVPSDSSDEELVEV